MARVTVEDCVGEDKTENRFELVILAAQRTKDIQAGIPITVATDNDKNPVIALREIAAKNIKIDELRTRFVNSLHPQSSLSLLEEEIEVGDKTLEVEREFNEEENYALTEEQMLMDEDSAFSFEDESILDDDKKF